MRPANAVTTMELPDLRGNLGETRIASPELLPKIGLLPHLICSRINNFGSCDEEGELAELDLCCAGGGKLGEQPVLVVG
jgi:hypothetical protein